MTAPGAWVSSRKTRDRLSAPVATRPTSYHHARSITITLGQAGTLRNPTYYGVRQFVVWGWRRDGSRHTVLNVNVQEAVVIDDLRPDRNRQQVGEHSRPVLHVAPDGQVHHTQAEDTVPYYHARSVDAAILRAGGGDWWVERTGLTWYCLLQNKTSDMRAPSSNS